MWSPSRGVSTVALNDGRLVTLASISPNGTMSGYAGVVGGSAQSVLISPSGQTTMLPTFGDTLTLIPAGVSDRGGVVGRSATVLGWPRQVFYWRQDVGLVDLSTRIGRVAFANGINPSGTTVFGSVDDTPINGRAADSTNVRVCGFCAGRDDRRG